MKKIFVLLILPIITLSHSCQKKPEPIPVIIVTDFGRDVDDAEAIAYCVFSENINPVLIIHNSQPTEDESSRLRNFLKLCNSDTPIITVRTPEENDFSPDDLQLIRNIFNKYTPSIAVLSPPTAITNILYNEQYENLTTKIFVQAYPTVDYISDSSATNTNICLLADDSSYNTRLDMEATQRLYDLGDRIPFTFIGKYEAYKHRLTKEDILNLTHSKEVNQMLWEEARNGSIAFAQKDSATYFRVFKLDQKLTLEEALKQQVYFSNPYDLLTVMAIDQPHLFNFTNIGWHRIIGDKPE